MAKAIKDKNREELFTHIDELRTSLRQVQSELRYTQKCLSDEKERHVRLFSAKQAAEKTWLGRGKV